MNLDVRDPLLLASVPPTNVEAYLRSAGWEPTVTEEGVFSIWSLSGIPDKHELRVPLDMDADAYAQRVREMLQELGTVERRSTLRVFLDVRDWNCDAIRVGFSARPGMEYPSINAAIATLENARELLTAMACSLIDPQPWYARRRPKEALDYLASLEVSPFEEPLNVRILARLEAALFGSDESEFVPLARRVSLRTREALDHLDYLLNRTNPAPESDWLTPCLQYGLSANVMESLSGLLELPLSLGAVTEISVRLAAARSFPGAAISTWRFRRSHLPALREMSDRLKSFASGPDERLLFVVADIRSGKRSTKITGTALIGDDARRIEMSVDEELARIAELAKSRNSAIQCFGRVRRRPDSGRHEILQPHDFQIVHSEDATVAALRRKIPQAESGRKQLPLIDEQS